MAVQTIKRSVTSTVVKSAIMKNEDGDLKAEWLPEEILIGNVKMDKAQKIIRDKHGDGAVVHEVKTDTEEYEMPVTEFIQLAEKVQPQEQEELELD